MELKEEVKRYGQLNLRLEVDDRDPKSVRHVRIFIGDNVWAIDRITPGNEWIAKNGEIIATKRLGITGPFSSALEAMYEEIDKGVEQFKQLIYEYIHTEGLHASK